MRHADAIAALTRLNGRRLGTAAAAVYLVLVVRSDDDGISWPSTASIGDDIGASPGHVGRQLGRLVAAGLTTAEPRPGRSTRYRILSTTLGTGARGFDATPRTGARDPAHRCAPTPRTGARQNVKGNGVKNGTPRASPEYVDPHDQHRPGSCPECDAGRARVASMIELGP